MGLAYLAYFHAQKVDWSLWESSWFTYDFATGEVSCVSPGIELSRKCQFNGAVVHDCALPSMAVRFLAGEAVFLSYALSIVRHLVDVDVLAEICSARRTATWMISLVG